MVHAITIILKYALLTLVGWAVATIVILISAYVLHWIGKQIDKSTFFKRFDKDTVMTMLFVGLVLAVFWALAVPGGIIEVR